MRSLNFRLYATVAAGAALGVAVVCAAIPRMALLYLDMQPEPEIQKEDV